MRYFLRSYRREREGCLTHNTVKEGPHSLLNCLKGGSSQCLGEFPPQFLLFSLVRMKWSTEMKLYLNVNVNIWNEIWVKVVLIALLIFPWLPHANRYNTTEVDEFIRLPLGFLAICLLRGWGCVAGKWFLSINGALYMYTNSKVSPIKFNWTFSQVNDDRIAA